MTDERQGLPSASEYHRIAACPGMLNLKRSLPPREEESSPDAESGTRIAKCFDGSMSPDDLSDDEHRTFDRLKHGREEIEKVASMGPLGPLQRFAEERLWLTDANGPIFSGRYDVLVRVDDIALVIDDKSGRNEVTKADGNLQLRALAVLVFINYGIKRVIVAINQPWFDPPFSIAEYSEADLSRAYNELMVALAHSENQNAPRTPGSHCNYCPCIAHCHEAREYSLAAPMTSMPATITPAAIAATLTAQTLADFLDRRVMAKKIIEACEKEARRRLEWGHVIPGWILKENAPLTPITDSELVYSRAEKLGVSYDDFRSCVSIVKEKLEAAVRKTTGQKGKALEDTMETLINGATTEKFKEPSLAKEKV